MRLEELFGSILEMSPSDLMDESSQATIPTWSSLAHISIITALEETYGASFSTEEIQAMKSLGDARRILRTKGVSI